MHPGEIEQSMISTSFAARIAAGGSEVMNTIDCQTPLIYHLLTRKGRDLKDPQTTREHR
jgi:hypothetical protein